MDSKDSGPEMARCATCFTPLPRVTLKPFGLHWALICVVCVQEPENLVVANRALEEQVEAARLITPHGLIVIDHLGARPALNQDVQPIINLAMDFYDPVRALAILSDTLAARMNLDPFEALPEEYNHE